MQGQKRFVEDVGAMIQKLYYPIYVLITVLGQATGALLLAISLLPGFFLIRAAWDMTAGTPYSLRRSVSMCLVLGISFFLTGDTLLLVIVLFRALFRITNREMSGDYRSALVLNNAAYNFLINLAQTLFLPFVRGTPLLIWFYRGMGAKIGKWTIITTTRIYDCDLIEIGDYCVIGGNVAINAHTGEGRLGILKRVRIGNRVTIGANSIIMPGVIIEDDVVIGANALIPKYAHLEANSTYGGVPAKKIP